MINIYNAVKDFLKKSECNKLILCQKPSYNFFEFTNVSPMSGDKRKEVTTKTIKDITLATNFVKRFDNYQLLLCKEIENNSHDPQYASLLSRYRIIMCGYLKKYELIVEQITLDIKNKQLVHELSRILEKMRDLLCRLEESIFPE